MLYVTALLKDFQQRCYLGEQQTFILVLNYVNDWRHCVTQVTVEKFMLCSKQTLSLLPSVSHLKRVFAVTTSLLFSPTAWKPLATCLISE